MDTAALDDLADWIADLAQRSGVAELAEVVPRIDDPELSAAFEKWKALERAGAPATEQRAALRDFVAAAQEPKGVGRKQSAQLVISVPQYGAIWNIHTKPAAKADQFHFASGPEQGQRCSCSSRILFSDAEASHCD